MRNLVFVLFAVAACAPTTQPPETPRPSAASGGIRAAEAPKVDRWVSLGVPVESAPSQLVVNVAGNGGKVGTLLVKGVAGEAEVEQVTVEYMNEQSVTFTVDKRLLPGDAQVIELREDHAISKIVVIVDPDSKGAIEIFGA